MNKILNKIKVFVFFNEDCGILGLTTKKADGEKAFLTEKELAFVEKAESDFQAAQDILRIAVEAANPPPLPKKETKMGHVPDSWVL